MSYIKKVLIANRGEIACRVIRTAKKMGIQTVAVYSDIDRDSMFVSMADQAYHIGPSPALESYLKSDKIIDVAMHSKAQAIHPGFGFLSENADFAEDCEKNNIIFVGPPADAIRKMGSKSESKIIMTKAQVPVVPGYHGEDQSYQTLLSEAKKIGFPVLIKAVMGGGGKGMRIVHRASEFAEALESAKRESLKAFRDDRVLVEKYIELPRHIEVQVFGDKYGNYVHFFERDCSIQRRHQKVIEEAPSALNESLRMDIGEKAKEAARAVKYTNAGTVEFIFDLSTNKYYFMEMNTRLQVEHPISEMITNTDLVELQLRIAAGEKLPKTQKEITRRGHSIEARIYSEQPNNNFLPGNGKLEFYKEPNAVEDEVRIETGVRQQDQISIFYDPMIAKLVVWGETRAQAIRTLSKALREYRIVGLPNNIYFLKQILDHPEYQELSYDTSFIQKNKDKLLSLKDNYSHIDIASGIVLQQFLRSQSVKLPQGLKNFRNNYQMTQEYSLQLSSECYQDKKTVQVTLQAESSDKYTVQIENQTVKILKIVPLSNNRYQITTSTAVFERDIYQKGQNLYIFDEDGDPVLIEFLSEQIQEASTDHQLHGENVIKAPMPCTLTKVCVDIGVRVTKGQTLLILEAMKMEHTIRASKDGVVQEIKFKEGHFIDPGSVILKIE